MITGYAVIIDDEILYCSNEKKYTVFEILLFIEKLITAINPKQEWRINKIIFQDSHDKKLRMIIKHVITKDHHNVFYCILGNIRLESRTAMDMLEEFYDKVNDNYNSVDFLKNPSKKELFREVISILTRNLTKKYESLLKQDIFTTNFTTELANKILYCGISSQGLPIISELYDTSLLDNLNKDLNSENVELFSSNLSAHLATVEMNSKIRANLNLKEIHIEDVNSKEFKKIFIFTDINEYSLDFFASGESRKIKSLLEQLKNDIASERVLKEDFSGDLKPYKHLKKFFDKATDKWKKESE